MSSSFILEDSLQLRTCSNPFGKTVVYFVGFFVVNEAHVSASPNTIDGRFILSAFAINTYLVSGSFSSDYNSLNDGF